MGIALRILTRRELAEEALQETYVRAWQKASQFDPALGSAVAWLAAICRNQAIDIRRRQAERIAGLVTPLPRTAPMPPTRMGSWSWRVAKAPSRPASSSCRRAAGNWW